MATKYVPAEKVLNELAIVFEALSTGGQRIFLAVELSDWSGIHIGPNDTAELSRSFKFKIVGRDSDGTVTITEPTDDDIEWPPLATDETETYPPYDR